MKKTHIKINVAKSAGFCFGVKRALKIASELARSSENVQMLGDIVHNEEVVKEIEAAGIKKIKKLKPGKNKTLLIRAHGTDRQTIQKAVKLGYHIVDATCPMVKEIHRIAQNMEQKGYSIAIIGDKKHDEVHGIVGQLKGKALVIDDPAHIPLKSIRKNKKSCVIVQSTQSLDKVLKIVGVLKSHLGKVEFINTICRPTRIKQEEIKVMPRKNDVMIVIGSKTSANTRRLYEISRALNPCSFWVQTKQQINPGWFKKAKKVGITAGASTPATTTKEIIAYIKQIT